MEESRSKVSVITWRKLEIISAAPLPYSSLATCNHTSFRSSICMSGKGQENASVGSVKSPCAKRPEIGFRLERREGK